MQQLRNRLYLGRSDGLWEVVVEAGWLVSERHRDDRSGTYQGSKNG